MEETEMIEKNERNARAKNMLLDVMTSSHYVSVDLINLMTSISHCCHSTLTN